MQSTETLKVIGHIHTPYKQKFGTPRQSGLVPSSVSTINLTSEFVAHGALDGLEEFSHIWVLFLFHKNTHKGQSGKVFPPRLNGEKRGLFATRTPHRPNSIGMSLVKIHKVDSAQRKLQVLGADLVDETPIIDIKPYIPQFDSAVATVPNWISDTESSKLNLSWRPSSLLNKGQLSASDIQLVEEVLKNDIRNVKDKNDADEKKIYRVYLQDFDVSFYVIDDQVEIIDIIFQTLTD